MFSLIQGKSWTSFALLDAGLVYAREMQVEMTKMTQTHISILKAGILNALAYSPLHVKSKNMITEGLQGPPQHNNSYKLEYV